MYNSASAKLRAKKLREVIVELGYPLSHAESLETLSRFEGFRDWNTYSASLTKQKTLLPIPNGWTVSGDSPECFDIGCDPRGRENQNPYPVIKSKENINVGSHVMATLMQSIKAKDYIDSTIQLSARIKAIDVTGAVTIWLRIDGASYGETLSFSNLEKVTKNGVIKDTADWTYRAIVLQVPTSAESIHFGFYLRGQGTAYASNFSLRKVSNDVAVTRDNNGLADGPQNLDFQPT